jgi:hypothetical protein
MNLARWSNQFPNPAAAERYNKIFERFLQEGRDRKPLPDIDLYYKETAAARDNADLRLTTIPGMDQYQQQNPSSGSHFVPTGIDRSRSPEQTVIHLEPNRYGAHPAPQLDLDAFTQFGEDETLNFDYTDARGNRKIITGLTPAFVRPSVNHPGKRLLVGFLRSENSSYVRKTFRTDRITNVAFAFE